MLDVDRNFLFAFFFALASVGLAEWSLAESV